LTTGGLGQTDIGNKAAIGGIAREFYRAVRTHYEDPAAWKWQTRTQYADSGQTRTASGEDTMWTFEPSAALTIFHQWVRENHLEVVYGMDSHNVQRYVNAHGQVQNEGDVEVGGFTPYPISYRAIVPKTDQCGNLLVPVCLSATHIAFGSIRMEPVFMVLGQSAATAAAHAIDEQVVVQRVDYATRSSVR
jgi:hypothetical protein